MTRHDLPPSPAATPVPRPMPGLAPPIVGAPSKTSPRLSRTERAAQSSDHAVRPHHARRFPQPVGLYPRPARKRNPHSAAPWGPRVRSSETFLRLRRPKLFTKAECLLSATTKETNMRFERNPPVLTNPSFGTLTSLRWGDKDTLRGVPFCGKDALVKSSCRTFHHARVVERNCLVGGRDDPASRRHPDRAVRQNRAVLALAMSLRNPGKEQ